MGPSQGHSTRIGESQAQDSAIREAKKRLWAEKAKRLREERTRHCQALLDQALSGEPIGEDLPHSEREIEMLRGVFDCSTLVHRRKEICSYILPKELKHNCLARLGFWTQVMEPDASWPEILARNLRVECLPSFSEVECEGMSQAVVQAEPEFCPEAMGVLCKGIASRDLKRCDGNIDCEEMTLRLHLLQEGGVKAVAERGMRKDLESTAAMLGFENPCKAPASVFMKHCVEAGLGER